MKYVFPIIAAALAIGLGGCANTNLLNTPMVVDTEYNNAYLAMYFRMYHENRDTRVDVVGDSLGADHKSFGNAVTKAMYGNNSGRPSNFTTNPGPSAEKYYHVVMAFNVEENNYLCEARKFTPAPVAGKTVLQGAWCWGNETQTYVLASSPATVPGTATFNRLIAATTLDLFSELKDNEVIEDDGDQNLP